MENNIQIGARTFVRIDKVLYLESDINYTSVYYQDGSKQVLSYTLKKVFSFLAHQENLIRINRHIVINSKKIKSNKMGLFEVSPGKMVCISRRRKLSLNL